MLLKVPTLSETKYNLNLPLFISETNLDFLCRWLSQAKVGEDRELRKAKKNPHS